MDSSTPKRVRIWRAALVVVAAGFSVYLCAVVGTPVASAVLSWTTDSIAIREGVMPPDAHLCTPLTIDWSEFPVRLLARGDWHVCDRLDEFVAGYYEVDLISRRVVDSDSEDWSEDPEPVFTWTDFVAVDPAGQATFGGTITSVAIEDRGALPRLAVQLDGDASREIVVTIPWDTVVISASGAPLGCAEFIASLEGSLPAAVAIEVESVGGDPWATRIELHE